MASTSTENSLNITLPAEQMQVVKMAASMRGQTVAEFATSTLLTSAQQVLDEPSTTKLSTRDAQRVMEILEEEAKPNEALVEAVRHYKSDVFHVPDVD